MINLLILFKLALLLGVFGYYFVIYKRCYCISLPSVVINEVIKEISPIEAAFLHDKKITKTALNAGIDALILKGHVIKDADANLHQQDMDRTFLTKEERLLFRKLFATSSVINLETNEALCNEILSLLKDNFKTSKARIFMPDFHHFYAGIILSLLAVGGVVICDKNSLFLGLKIVGYLAIILYFIFVCLRLYIVNVTIANIKYYEYLMIALLGYLGYMIYCYGTLFSFLSSVVIVGILLANLLGFYWLATKAGLQNEKYRIFIAFSNALKRDFGNCANLELKPYYLALDLKNDNN